MEWQPIETAPRDGTPILVAVEGGRFYADKAEWTASGWAYPCHNHGPEISPTHWMPLPPPPE